MTTVVRIQCLLACSLLLGAAGAGEVDDSDEYQDGQIVIVTGRLRVVGSEPFTRLALHTDDGVDFYLPADLGERLQRRQNQRVQLRGRVRITGGGGASAFKEYHLSDVKILPDG